MKIPRQLKNCRFVPVGENKNPLTNDWPRTGNYSYEEFTPQNNRYGIVCGINGLVVIDCDDKKSQEALLKHEEFRRTFTVKTAGKGLYHFYFYTENPETKRYNDARDNRILDVQGPRTQVIGPGTEMSGRTYEVVNDAPIQTINKNYLYTIIENHREDLKVITDPIKKESKFVMPEFDETCKKIKEKIKVADLIPKQNNPGPCPLGHTSEGGACFSHDDVLWHCFHCMKSGNVFHLYMELHKTNFLTARQALARKAGIQEEYYHTLRANISDPKTANKAVELIAEEAMKTRNIYTIRNDHTKEIYIYQEGIYEPNGASYLKEFVREVLGYKYKEIHANKVIEKIMVDTYIKEEEFFRDPPINLIPLENGVYNLNNKKLEKYDPSIRFFNKHPVIYDPSITPDKTLKFITDITPRQEDVDTIQELAGYLFYRDYKFEKAFMFLGKGRNGKTKLLELFKALVGAKACTEVSIKAAEEDHFALSEFHKKNANISGDLSNSVIEFTGKFKDLVGRGTLRGDRKFKNPVYFTNYAKMIFATNDLPYTKDHSEGFWNRWVFVDFPYRYVPEPTLPNEKLEDPDIIDNLTTQKEITGLFNWALTGLERLFKNKRFSNNKTAEKIRMKWFRESSSVACFFEEEITKTNNPEDKITISDFDFVYNQYCTEHGVDSDNRNVKNEMLKKLGVSKGKNASGWYYAGIKFKNDSITEEEEVNFE